MATELPFTSDRCEVAAGQQSEACSPSKDVSLFEAYGRLINPTYPSFLSRFGLNNAAHKAEGATIIDSDGNSYIDCIAGYGAFNLGHNHPGIVAALTDQLGRCQLFTKPLISEIQVTMAESLEAVTPGELTCSFVVNSGSEAIDSALKLVRLHKGAGQIITARNSFHGHTFGALAASGMPSFKRSFEPLVPGFVHVPFGDIEALKESICADTAAVMIEPIQHEAGVSVPPDGYVRQVRRLCDENDLMLVFDEIKTGFGKTGRMFACDHFETVPDILVVGKSLGGGLMPIGAVIAKRRFWQKFGLSFPMSASTFSGNVLACRAGIETIRLIEQQGLPEACAKKGAFLLNEFRRCVEEYPGILRGVKGLGLLIGIETRASSVARNLAQEMIRQKVLAVPAFANPAVLMIEPALIISFEQINRIANTFAAACGKISAAGEIP